ncbi:hypothetical protein dsx2_0158 [Desulfovibrio sp. X2]|uniref:histidinol dehydrogenase n=1 Tax=Desulfovibrio sp. X2 TaxID=941449 RepID=UPI0003586ED1|nr:histidinol dehydrogenase [Desulfovibrio sp. X2]EPR42231.1 hypothetical protein dsx2_0158 [Desulfovibrio sp. X2]
MNYEILTPLERCALPDGVFAAAYDVVDEADKAAFKRCIAAQYALFPPAESARFEVVERRAGFATFRAAWPLDWVCILLPATPVSPLKLLAALLPARTSGARAVAVVRPEHAVWEDGVLAALELAGQEDVFAASPAVWKRQCATLGKAGGAGLSMLLGTGNDAGEGLEPPSGGRLWLAPASRSLGVFCENKEAFDLASLARLHPDSTITAFGTPKRTKGVTCRAGSWEDFVGRDFDAAYVPAELLEEALSRFSLAFGTGGEAHWLWPGLTAATFTHSRLGLKDG